MRNVFARELLLGLGFIFAGTGCTGPIVNRAALQNSQTGQTLQTKPEATENAAPTYSYGFSASLLPAHDLDLDDPAVFDQMLAKFSDPQHVLTRVVCAKAHTRGRRTLHLKVTEFPDANIALRIALESFAPGFGRGAFSAELQGWTSDHVLRAKEEERLEVLGASESIQIFPLWHDQEQWALVVLMAGFRHHVVPNPPSSKLPPAWSMLWQSAVFPEWLCTPLAELGGMKRVN
jgi:hypothetical protein